MSKLGPIYRNKSLESMCYYAVSAESVDLYPFGHNMYRRGNGSENTQWNAESATKGLAISDIANRLFYTFLTRYVRAVSRPSRQISCSLIQPKLCPFHNTDTGALRLSSLSALHTENFIGTEKKLVVCIQCTFYSRHCADFAKCNK